MRSNLLIGSPPACRGRREGRLDLAFDLAGGAVGDHQFEIAAVDHFAFAVVVQVVNLAGHIAGEPVAPQVRLAALPQLLAVERHGRQAANLGVAILGTVIVHLSYQDINLAVPIQVAEADIAAGAETARVDLLPDHHRRIGGLQPRLFLLAPRRFVVHRGPCSQGTWSP